MVKIHIEDHPQFQGHYLTAVKEELANRLKWLLIAISHLEGAGIVLTSTDQARVKYYTRRLTGVIDGAQYLAEKNYDAAAYISTVAGFKATSAKLAGVDFSDLKKLLTRLLAQNGSWLELLLTFVPQNLIKAERFLIRNYKINASFNKEVLKLIFYVKGNPLWEIIKHFFRKNLPLIACPYCNMVVIKPIEIAGSLKYAKTAALDHFYDETRHPVLAFSLYNLIPSDIDCNTTNKNTKEFKYNYHLNPYEEGFGKHVRFKAIIDPPDSIRDLTLVLDQNITPEKKKRVLGDVSAYDGAHEHGNINVFKLNTLYGDSYYKKKASQVIADIKNMNDAKASLKKLIQLLTFDQKRSHKAYMNWYENKLKTPFYEKDFQHEILSKLTRDLHDGYYEKKAHPLNSHIRTLINADDQ